MPKASKEMDSRELMSMLISLSEEYPIISLEDGMSEDDFCGWQQITETLGKKLMLVGDDLFVTNKERLELGIKKRMANAILLKPNQIGTLSEVIETAAHADAFGYKCIMSHRSGETADTFIADLSAALGCQYIKTGAPARSDRVEKYNRLMKIESEIFDPFYRGRRGF